MAREYAFATSRSRPVPSSLTAAIVIGLCAWEQPPNPSSFGHAWTELAES
jgi:hypothetical protein